MRAAKTSRGVRTAALAALAAVGCAPVVQNIAVATPGAITPSSDAVTIVVIQPATHLRSVSLLDGQGQLVGQLDDRSHTAVRVPEGPTILYAVIENESATADRIEGTLVPGRIYYATIEARSGGVALTTLTPRSPDGRWRHKDEWLGATPRVQMDSQKMGRAINEVGDPAPILRAGDAHVAGLDAAHRAEHEIQESDGL